jgi:putative membrane protein
MNLLHGNLAKKFTHLIGIIGVSSTIAVPGYAQINQRAIAPRAVPKAIAHTTPNNSRTLETKISQASLSEIDMVYVQEAAQAGMAEVELAKLALEKSKNSDVRQYAKQMIADHTPLNEQLIELAQQKGITLPTTASPKYQALKAQLSELSGSNFDQAYINEAGINGHMENLVIHTRQIQLGQDRDLQAFAAKTIPVIERHLQLLDLLFMQFTDG